MFFGLYEKNLKAKQPIDFLSKGQKIKKNLDFSYLLVADAPIKKIRQKYKKKELIYPLSEYFCFGSEKWPMH